MVTEYLGDINATVRGSVFIDTTSPTRLRVFMIRIKNYARATKSLYEEMMPFRPDDGIIIADYADLLHSMELLDEAVAAFERAMATGNVNGTVINDFAALLFKMASRTGDETM
jgi:Tfp pilus assembly protein PilF